FLLPLLAGIAGLFWQYGKDRKGFWHVLAFFVMTGLAIIFYLNQYPNQPRERDYAYAGSFYAFSIWIGFGFAFLVDAIKRFAPGRFSSIIAFLLLIPAVPVLMAFQNWDDHDRSGRYTARDIGANYLKSCADNAILFTYGDNDSFPVWYVQDVEQVRPDVRVANLSYLQAGWYIEMMRQKAFDSDPMPLSLPPDKYLEGDREQLPVNDRVKDPVDLRRVVDFAANDDSRYKMDVSGRGDFLNFLPANKFIIEVDTAAVLANGTVKEYFRDRIVSPMIWEYTESDAFKGDLAIMDMLSTNEWKRPVYFSTTVPSTQYKGLEKFFVQEGLAYRVVPVQTDKPEQGEFGMIDNEVMYDNMMNKFTWGNAGEPGVYLDENNKRMFSNFRRLFGELAKSLLVAGDTARAVEVVHKGLSIVPSEKMPNDYFSINLAEVLLLAGRKEEGIALASEITGYSVSYLEHIINIRPQDRFGLDYPMGVSMQSLLDLYNLAVRLEIAELSSLIEPSISKYYSRLYSTQ
ncbi:MAG: hypothetical protein MUE32_05825, partial [Bacteroidales bacterium]|nr:hypothetical protein [Bacteroidales bacterium]